MSAVRHLYHLIRVALAMADSKPGEGGFLSRWSQRKAQARNTVEDQSSNEIDQKKSLDDINIISNDANIDAAVSLKNPNVSSDKDISEKSVVAGPTLEDVAKLTADSDYSAFAAKSVDPQVRNAAMRKLFAADPHFNVMDRLDVYIDDYSVGEPIPQSMLRQMVQARSLGLLDDDLVDQDKPSLAETPEALAGNDTAPHHENPDLQLQRDDASGFCDADARVEPPVGAEPEPDTGLDPEPGPGRTA